MVRSWVLGAAAAFMVAAGALGEGNRSGALNVKTVRAVVFKDGYCTLVKEASGPVDAAGRATIEGIPAAMVLGTFWIMPEDGKLASVISQQVTISKRGQQETKKSLLLQFGPGSAGRDAKLTLSYTGPGIRWIPTYRIALGKDGTADLMLQEEMLNEAEDLAGVPVDLVVGVPNFRFKEVVSPMSLEATLLNALQRVAPQIMGQAMSNTLFTQRAGESRGEGGGPAPAGPGVPALPPELAGEGAQDLFVYHVPQLTLAAGERASIPLISAKVPFRHLYTWDVQLSRSGAESLPGAGSHVSPLKLLKNDVWHLVELTNNTDVPLTTGAALTMDGYLPLGQELLTYTSVGGKCQLPLTVAVDVRGTYQEEETARDLKGFHFDGNDYVRVAKKGTLRVTNFKKEAIDLLVTCQLGGTATQASDDGKVSVTDFRQEDWSNFRGHPALTGHSTVQWTLGVKPGETKELTCEYFYYTR